MEWKSWHRTYILGQFGWTRQSWCWVIAVVRHSERCRNFLKRKGNPRSSTGVRCVICYADWINSTSKTHFQHVLDVKYSSGISCFAGHFPVTFFTLYLKNRTQNAAKYFSTTKNVFFYFWCYSWKDGGPVAGLECTCANSAHGVVLLLTSCITLSNELMYATMCILFEDLLSLCNSVFCSPSCKPSSFHIGNMKYRLWNQNNTFFHFINTFSIHVI